MNFGAYVTTLNSGWLQTIFTALPVSLHLPFIVAYGIAQPVLPAAIADPAVWPVRLIWHPEGPGLVYVIAFPSLLPAPDLEDGRQAGTHGLDMAVAGYLVLDYSGIRSRRRRPMGQPTLPGHTAYVPSSAGSLLAALGTPDA